MKSEIVLASGRCDPPHCGHIVSFLRLGQLYKKVLVVILDHDSQKYSPQYRAQIIKEILGMSKGNYEVIVNKEHFGEITKKDAEKYGKFVYASGNLKCVKHMDELGYEVIYIDRAYDYEASDDRKLRSIKEALDG